MSSAATMTVRLNPGLYDFVRTHISQTGTYENISEYIRALIRRDKEQTEQVAYERLKAELQQAFNAPEETYQSLTADDIIRRHTT
ncbi:MAG: addiction module antitoxin [Pseudomonadota bacterium]